MKLLAIFIVVVIFQFNEAGSFDPSKMHPASLTPSLSFFG
jgi:hypothetical protein